MKKPAYSRILSLLLACSMLFAFLTACGGSSQGQNAGGNTSAPAEGTAPAQTGDTAPADNKVYDLSFSTHDPAGSYKTKMHEEWARRINEESGGRINITVYTGGSLAASNEALDAVRTGQCDSAWVFSNYFPNQFPLAEVITLPLGFSSVPQATNVLWDLYEAYPEFQAQFKDFKLIMLHSNAVNVVCTDKDHPVDEVADLKGLVIRCTAGIPTDLLKVWGANPITMGPGDIYEAIQKGVISGATFDYSGVRAFKLQEVVKYFCQQPVYLGPYFLLMNKNSFEKLPADLQEIVTKHSGRDISLEMAYVFEGDEKLSRDLFKEAGCEFLEISEENKAEFKSYGQGIIDQWMKDHENLGIDIKAYLDKTVELAAKYEVSQADLDAKLKTLGY